VKHHDIFSLDKNDIGLATNLKHRIDLKNKEPTYRKQFPIPDAQRGELGRSRYNSLLFIIPKKD
jgi:hypothetical protein